MHYMTTIHQLSIFFAESLFYQLKTSERNANSLAHCKDFEKKNINPRLKRNAIKVV